jgi:hypothetical protein
MRDPKAHARASSAFEALLGAARAPGFTGTRQTAAAPGGRRR